MLSTQLAFSRFRLLASLLSCMWFGCPANVFGQDYTYQLVNHPDSLDTIVTGMNNDGMVVGQHGTIDFSRAFNPNVHGFVFDGETYTDVVYPGAVSTFPEGINDAGIVVGSYINTAGRTAAFRFDGANYETLSPPSANEASALDINRNGDIVGTMSNDRFSSDVRGFRLFDGVFEEIGYPGAAQTFMGGINDRREIVGTFFDGETAAAFVNTEFAPIRPSELGTPDGRAINDRSEVVGNDRVIVEFVDFVNVRIATNGFLYDQNEEDFRQLFPPVAECTTLLNVFEPEVSDECIRSIRDINDHGEYVGYADDESGNLVGFIATPTDHLLGDYGSRDGSLDEDDVNELMQAIRGQSLDDAFDLDRNDVMDAGRSGRRG